MSKLIWDDIAARDYEAGVDRGVFYPLNGPGQVWNGLVSVEESPSEADDRPRYLDGKRIGNRRRLGEFSATVSAFTYPTSFSPVLVEPIRRTLFGLSYRTQSREGYKIHLVYNAIASPRAATTSTTKPLHSMASHDSWRARTRWDDRVPLHHRHRSGISRDDRGI